jgi:large subunit ribosomal protein L6e
MAKSREDLRKKMKERRTRLQEANKSLNKSKWGYPVTDEKKHFKRPGKKVNQTRLRKDIQQGQVLIVLSGRFRGRRVIFLKQLSSGMLLVTGPYKLNGVPLKRVNQAYVLPTKTRVNLGALPGLDKVDDQFFSRKVAVKRNATKLSDFVEDAQKKRERVTEERRNAQNTVDTEVLKSVRSVPLLKEYLQNRFSLKNGDKPHLMSY